ncbi:hypothetical protein [Sphingomonas sp. PB2P12]|uniref:hypothetical protein n=1 Tax=Sphingomonas sandaracina TaxID=3096157 RepID=UPI002FC788EE
MLDPSAIARLDDALLRQPQSVKTVIADLKPAIMACDARSHPYGFVVVTLGTGGDGGRVRYRLHIWRKGFSNDRSADLMIHDHVYDLASHVLVGGFLHDEYVESAATGTEYACYRGLYDGPHSELKRTDRTMRASLARSSNVAAGDTYHLAARKLHVVTVDPDVFTATVLRTEYGPDLADPVILAPMDADNYYRFDRHLVASADANRSIDELFQLIA